MLVKALSNVGSKTWKVAQWSEDSGPIVFEDDYLRTIVEAAPSQTVRESWNKWTAFAVGLKQIEKTTQVGLAS